MSISTQRELQDVLQNQLLPWLRLGSLEFLTIDSPAESPLGTRNAPPPIDTEIDLPHGKSWPALGMELRRYPCLVCVLDGELHMCVYPPQGQTPVKGRKQPNQASRTRFVTVPNRACFIIPPNVPYSDSSSGYWQRSYPDNSVSMQLWVVLQPTGAALHICRRKGSAYSYTPVLLAQDPRILILSQVLSETAECRGGVETLNALLLSLLLCIREALRQNRLIETEASAATAEQADEARRPRAMAVETKSASLERVCLYIRSHLRSPLSLDEIARNTYITPPQLNRLFRAHFGMPVMKYVNQCRMEEAKSLLALTNLPVREIGGLYGFRNRSHFCTAFTRWAGVSPRGFRTESH